MLNYEEVFFFLANDSEEKSIDKSGDRFPRRRHSFVRSMLHLEEYHRYRQASLGQDRRHQLLADHPLQLCSDQYTERCPPRTRSTSFKHHFQTLFFLARLSSISRVSESEKLNAISASFKCVLSSKNKHVFEATRKKEKDTRLLALLLRTSISNVDLSEHISQSTNIR